MVQKKHRPFFLNAAPVAITLLVGCTVAVPSTPTYTPLPQTQTPLPRVTLASAQPTPRVTLASTQPTEVPTTTSVAVPTLTYQQKADFVEKMILTNGGCELPCWWGGAIVPGTTTLEEAVHYFASQGLSKYSLVEGKLIWDFGVPPESSRSYVVSIRIPDKDGIIERLQMTGRDYGSQSRFAQTWGEHYAWHRIMSQYGVPSGVTIRIWKNEFADPLVGSETLAEFVLTIDYHSLGMRIGYGGPAELIDAKVRACPRFNEVTQIGMTLSSNGGMLEPSGSEQAGLPKEIDLDPETFYETFRNPDGISCFDADAE